MRVPYILSLVFFLVVCVGRTSHAATFEFNFEPTSVDYGVSLKASGTFTVSGSVYTDATGTVYSDVSGTYVGSKIAGIDKNLSPAYNSSNIVFAFLADGESFLINGPPNAMLSDSESIVSGTFSVSRVGTVPLPATLPLSASALLILSLGGLGWKRRARS